MGASRKRFGAEEVVKLLRQIEVLQGNGKSLPEACKAVGIVEQTLRDELLNGELFYGLKELKVIVGQWVRHYNTERPHSSLGYRPPAPQAWLCSQARGASGPAPVEIIH